MREMREEACQPCAFGEAVTQKLLERDGAEADEGGGERMTMKNRDARRAWRRTAENRSARRALPASLLGIRLTADAPPCKLAWNRSCLK